MRAALNAIPDFRWCLASSCPNGQIHEAAIDGPIFSCSHCGAQHCVTHEVEWHKGETCQQYDYRVSGKKKRDEEKASARTILNTTKPCPKCTAHIEKNDGCDHMTCKHCRYEFCWVGIPYSWTITYWRLTLWCRSALGIMIRYEGMEIECTRPPVYIIGSSGFGTASP